MFEDADITFMRLPVLTIFLLLNTVVLANQIDDLRQRLSSLRGTLRIPVLLQLCDNQIKGSLPNAEALRYGSELFHLANPTKDTAALVEACLCVANNQNPLSQAKEAYNWLKKAEILARRRPKLLVKVKYWQAGHYNELGDWKTCISLLKQAQQLAQKHLFTTEEVRILGAMANIYSGRGQTNKADSLILLALRCCQSPQDSALYFAAQGAIQENYGHLDEALRAYLAAYRLDKKLNNLMPATRNLRESAAILRDQGQYKTAITYLQEAIDLSMQMGNINYLSATYHTLAGLYVLTQSYPQALHYHKLSFALKKDIAKPKKILASVQGINELYFLTGQYDSCLVLVQQYLFLSQKIKMREAEISLALWGSRAAMKVGKPSLARNLFDTGTTALRQEKAAEELIDGYELAANAAADLGDFAQAYQYRQLFQRARDSLYTIEKAAIVAELNARFDHEKKEEQIQDLARDNELQKERIARARLQRWVLFSGLLLVAAVALLLWRSSRVRQKQNMVLTQINQALSLKNKEVETLLREVHHRVKNNLQIISSLLRLQARGVEQADVAEALRISQSRVQSIALLHQRLYQGDGLNQVPIRTYFNDLTQSLRDTYQLKESQIQVDIKVDDFTIDIDLAIPLGLIANELMINAIKHAFPQQGVGCIELKVKKTAEQLSLLVKDNGVGLKLSSGKPMMDKNSFGLELVESLAEKIQGNLVFSNGQGTRIELLIPLEFSEELVDHS